MTGKRFNHAIVLGGSMAGLLTARVLSDHFEQVTLIERDRFPETAENRRGVPQGRHAHAILARGVRILEGLFPGLGQEMVAQGAELGDPAANGRWHQFGGYKLQFHAGLDGLLVSRALLETTVRRHVLARPNISARQEVSARELVAEAGNRRVTGVRIAPRMMEDREGAAESETLLADLVVDATGRGSRSPQWLSALGYEAPRESTVKVNLAYATRLYRRQPAKAEDVKAFIMAQAPPNGTRGCAMLGIENDQWILTLFGYLGDHPPADEAGFLEFARSLPAPDVYNIISRSEPVSEITTYKFPANLRRHYEKLTRFPEGYLVIGDAVCSFNPIYGQGMSVSALEAEALGETMRGITSLNGLAKQFYKRAIPVIDVPWTLASGADLAINGVEGRRTPAVNLINAYVAKVHRATMVDRQVAQAFFNVANLIAAPPVLFKPDIVWRVLRAQAAASQMIGRPVSLQPQSLASR